jgi:pimeloyl-ACP methyl ester carboxylesterase
MDSLLLEPPGGYLRHLEFPGDDVPLVWLHGLGGAASADFAPVVASPPLIGRRSLLIDLFGHGNSDGPEEFGYTLEGHAHSVSQLLDHLSLKGCAVVGHSMGGSVAITLAALRPDLVSRLIIAEGNLDPGGGMVSTRIAEQRNVSSKRLGTGHFSNGWWATSLRHGSPPSGQVRRLGSTEAPWGLPREPSRR